MSTVSSRRIADLEATVAGMQARIERLEAVRPRDAADAALRQCLPRSTCGDSFKAAGLLKHATVDPELLEGLTAADLTTTAELGCWLRNQAGARDGVVIERLARRYWRAYTYDT